MTCKGNRLTSNRLLTSPRSDCERSDILSTPERRGRTARQPCRAAARSTPPPGPSPTKCQARAVRPDNLLLTLTLKAPSGAGKVHCGREMACLLRVAKE